MFVIMADSQPDILEHADHLNNFFLKVKDDLLVDTLAATYLIYLFFTSVVRQASECLGYDLHMFNDMTFKTDLKSVRTGNEFLSEKETSAS